MFKVIWNAIIGRKCGGCGGRSFLRISPTHSIEYNLSLPIWICKCGCQVLNGWVDGK